MSDRWCWNPCVDSRLLRSHVLADSVGNGLSGWRVLSSKGRLGVGLRRKYWCVFLCRFLQAFLCLRRADIYIAIAFGENVCLSLTCPI